MREIFTMWKDTRMIMLTAVSAAIYAAVLIPFKVFTILPGLTSVRPANVIPVVFGILFGPAAAWGAAIGNLIGDVFGGTLGPGSLFGFVGNFFFAFAAYKLWGNLGPLSSGHEPDMREDTVRQIVEYAVIAITSSVLCAVIIGWGVEVFKLLPFSVIATIIVVNNSLASVVLGPPLLYLIYPRIKDMGLLYPDVMDRADLPMGGSARQVPIAWGIVAVTILWLVVGLALSRVFGVPVGQGRSMSLVALGVVGFVLTVALSWLSAARLPDLLRS
ncbi:MAG: QueT transporter family protein [Haloarculaceae archaeon]